MVLWGKIIMGNRIGRMEQIRIYHGKCWRLFLNEKQWKNLISTLIITMLISLVTSDDTFRNGVQTKNSCFAIICACIWVGIFNSIQSVCRERGIIKREHRTGLHISSYIGAHVIFEGELCAVESIIILLVVMIKNASNLPEHGLIFPLAIDLWITLYLTVFASDMLAILVSCIVRDTNSAMTVMPFVLIVQLIFGGVVFELHGLADTLSNITVCKWGMNGLMSITFTVDSVRYDPFLKSNPWQKPEAGNLATIWLIIVVIAVFCAFLGTLALSFVDRDRR